MEWDATAARAARVLGLCGRDGAAATVRVGDALRPETAPHAAARCLDQVARSPPPRAAQLSRGVATRTAARGGRVIRTDDARREILRAIRENLKPRGIAPGSAELVVPTADPGPRARGSTARFTERLAAVGAHCTVVSGETDAA